MMRNIRAFILVFTVFFLTPNLIAEPETQIIYETIDLGSNQWEYIYTVENFGLSEGIEEFTVWFDHGLYDNLVVTTPETPPQWDQIVWQVEPVLGDPGGYDAAATNLYIDIGESLSDFSVSFDWLGTGSPGSQFYEIIDPDTFETIEDGYTVPEPVTLILLGTGILTLRAGCRKP
jgi:hypothetical protein